MQTGTPHALSKHDVADRGSPGSLLSPPSMCCTASCSPGERLERDAVAELLQAADEATLGAAAILPVEEGGAQIGIGTAAGEQVIDDRQQRVGDSDQSALGPAAAGDPTELHPDVGALGPHRSMRRLHQC
jgi:hypothetical protein